MAREIVKKSLSCVECGAKVSKHSLWVDDSGYLCHDCAVIKRFERMRGNKTPALQRGHQMNCGTSLAKRILGLPRKAFHIETGSC